MSIYLNYQNAIKENLLLNENDWGFKSNPNFSYMLEHVSYEQGNEYLDILNKKYNKIMNENIDLIKEICIQNDKYGKTIKNDFGIVVCSPSNLRYTLQSLLILEFAQKNNLKNINFIEIGGGYGGLSLFIHKLAKLFEIKINSYTIFDLEEPCLLQKKYLSLHRINILTANIFDNFDLQSNSFLISNYAFSEISDEFQKMYIQKVIEPYCSHGFLAWNNIDIYNFVKGKNIVTEREYPLTGNKNYYVYFS
jgi:hypothetical protein